MLHGTHGFARQYVEIAHDLSEQTGYVVAAGCWSTAQARTRARAISRRMGCRVSGFFPHAWSAVRTLSQAVRQYAGNTAKVGIFGHARGAEVALQLASSPGPDGAGVQAVVSSSGVYTAAQRTPDYDSPTPLSLAESLAAPVLILHGQADTQARFSNAALYYQRLQSLGRLRPSASSTRGWATMPSSARRPATPSAGCSRTAYGGARRSSRGPSRSSPRSKSWTAQPGFTLGRARR